MMPTEEGSILIPSVAIETLHHKSLYLYATLLRCAPDEGGCRPSMLAKRIGVNERLVRKRLRGLVELGFAHVGDSAKDGGRIRYWPTMPGEPESSR